MEMPRALAVPNTNGTFFLAGEVPLRIHIVQDSALWRGQVVVGARTRLHPGASHLDLDFVVRDWVRAAGAIADGVLRV